MRRRGKPELLEQLDEAERLDGRVKEIVVERDAIRHRVNQISSQIAAIRREGKGQGGDALMDESRQLGDKEQKLAAEFDQVNATLRDLLLHLPNIIHQDAPDGATDRDNPVVSGPP